MSERNEAEILRKAKEGDVKAFEELIVKYEKNVYNICFKMMKNEEDAKDVAQNIFIKIYQVLHKFDGKSSFSTWLYRVATNSCLDELRKQKRKNNRVIELDKFDGNDHQEIMTERNGEGPEDTALKKEKIAVVRAALDEMKNEQKVLIVLRDMQGMTYQEIAKILDIKEGTVKSRLSRSRKALKDILMNKELFKDRNV